LKKTITAISVKTDSVKFHKFQKMKLRSFEYGREIYFE
jgi:hypothetical protein